MLGGVPFLQQFFGWLIREEELERSPIGRMWLAAIRTRATEISAAQQVAPAVQSNGRRAESVLLTLAALSAALWDYDIAKADEGTDVGWRSFADRATTTGRVGLPVLR